MRDKVLAAIRRLGGRHNQCTIHMVGSALDLSPAELLPLIDSLRRDWLISAAVIEGRDGIEAGYKSYWTADGCGLVSIRE